MKKTARKMHPKQKRNVRRAKPKGKPPAALRRPAREVQKAIKTGKTKRVPQIQRRERAKAPPPREVGLLDAIGEVMADVEELGLEMREWADGMPENQQGGNKHSEVEAVAETLESVAGNDPVTENEMSFLNDIKLTVQDPTPRRRGYSRSARLGHALVTLELVLTALEDEFKTPTMDNDRRSIAEDLHTALEEEQANLEGVDFPGMYG